MANDQNQCNFTGRLGKDPETKQLGNGPVTNFSIAVSEQWRDKQTQEKKERTTWVNCVVYGALADVVAKYGTKGMFVRVTGKMQNRQWEQDGQTRYATEILVNEFQMLSSPQGQGQGQGQQSSQQHGGNSRPAQQPQQSRQQPAQQPQGGPAYDDDVPF